MFIAQDIVNKRIAIDDAVKGESYFCPLCGESLIVKACESTEIRTHFAHKRGTHCLDNWSHDMSEWHLSWQKQFPEQFREVVVEKNGIKHRADVKIDNSVIEFQHSPISKEEFEERNTFYTSCGYMLFWIFDASDKYKIKNRFGDSIDPLKCRENDFCWKREKLQFSSPLPRNVFVFIQYSTPISYYNQAVNILLPLKTVSSKDIIFEKYPFYIQPVNFLKQFGIDKSNGEEQIWSISDFINSLRNSGAQNRKPVEHQPIQWRRNKRRWRL